MGVETKYIHLLLLLLASFYVRIGSAQYETSCTTTDGRRGNCIRLRQCKYATDLIRQNGINSPASLQFLQSNSCGFEGRDQKVCCPQDQASSGGRNPFFPNNGNQNSGWNGNQNSGSNNQGNKGQGYPNPTTLLPNDCGYSELDRIIGGEKTNLGEFPWMAMLDYLESGRTWRSGCGGALISKRYVLTAAHCIRNIPSTWQLKSVRLGEHNLVSNPDCVNDGSGRKTCADQAFSVPVESIVVHESYGSPATFRNDIALLRLSLEIATTAYIRPICLPTNGAVSQNYWSAGWGQTNTERFSIEKLKVNVPYANFNRCAATYSTKRVVLGEGQMCAGGGAGKDTCKGDSGGPLMKQVQQASGPNRWFIEGVVSFGHSPCGLQDWPGVYTKVFNYVPWILRNLKP